MGKKPEPEGLFRAIISEGNPVPNHYFLSLTNAQSFLQKRKSDERTIFNALAKSQEIIDVIERQDGYEVVFSPEGDVEFDSKGQPVVFDPKGNLSKIF